MLDRPKVLLRQFIKDPEFLKSLVITFGLSSPILLGLRLDMLTFFLSITIGVLLTAGSDVPGSRRHKNIGMLTAAGLGGLVFALTGLAVQTGLFLLLPVMAFTVFFVSYLSVYGFRASLVSFSGLMALVFSLAQPHPAAETWIHSLLLILGGLWYMLLSNIFHSRLEKRQSQSLLAGSLHLTAEFIRLRGQLAGEKEENQGLVKRLFGLQVKINESHEALRAILLAERQHSGTSNYKRKQLLVLIDLIDILELSLANPANFQNTRELFRPPSKELAPFIGLVLSLAGRLENLGRLLDGEVPAREAKDPDTLLEDCRRAIEDYVEETGLPQAREGALVLHGLLEYEERIYQKILSIERVCKDLEGSTRPALQSVDAKSFLPQQDYSSHIFRENLSFKSTIFRHAARVSVALVVGYVLGLLFEIQNAYWILLTIVVIMRPGYTLTKERSKQRLYGTLIGAGAAAVIVLAVRDVYIYGVLSVVSLLFALSFIQKNYKTSSVFITTSVVFIYVLIAPDAFEVIGFRILDTLTGAGISMLAVSFLWPAWETANMKSVIAKAIRANKKYLEATEGSYRSQDSSSTAYKLARKEAFLEMGNLNAAFQRLNQEPKSRQGDTLKMYEMVGLNHTFLTAAAALGTFFQDHRPEPSENLYLILAHIRENLDRAISLLEGKEPPGRKINDEALALAYRDLESRFTVLAAQRDRQLEREFKPIEAPLLKNLQEARVLSDHLKWLSNISVSLAKAVGKGF